MRSDSWQFLNSIAFLAWTWQQQTLRDLPVYASVFLVVPGFHGYLRLAVVPVEDERERLVTLRVDQVDKILTCALRRAVVRARARGRVLQLLACQLEVERLDYPKLRVLEYAVQSFHDVLPR